MTDNVSHRPNPYPGPRAFQQGEKLYGRDRETLELLDLLIAERIVLLYSPSGAGKTSLIHAALIPQLEAEGFRVLPPMRVSLETPQADAGANRYILSLLLSLEEALPPDRQTPLPALADMALIDYLDQHPPPQGATGDLLVFDQFEEILTSAPAHRQAKIDFFHQVGAALRHRQRWALFAMREEFLASLDPFLRPIPTRFSNTYRLELLGLHAALDAMQQPAHAQGVDFSDEAAHKLADDLRTIRIQQPDGSTATALGPFVEPVQLQVVCRRLWDRLALDDTRITLDDLQEVGDVDTALRSYYAERVATIAADTGVRERTIRDWIDTQLITDQGLRGQVLQGASASQGLDNRAIWPLVDAHLVRAEQRRGATWFELAHDRLIEPLRADNAAWRQAHLSALQRQAALWDSEGRPKGLLLQGEALAQAEQWAAAHQQELEEHERDFLAACQEARRVAQREKQQARRIRRLAVGAMLFGIIAALLAVAAWNQLQAADAARQDADTARITAEAELHVRETAEAKAIDAANQARRAEATAEAERDRAEQQSQIALSRQVAAIARNTLEQGHGEQALLLAIGAYQITGTVEAENVLHQALVTWRGRGVLGPHAKTVFRAIFSPDGKTVATMAKAEVRLWEVGGQRRTLALLGHEKAVTDMKFSPDGRYLATVSRDGTGRLWQVETGQQVWQVPVPREGTSVAFRPDGQILAFGGDDGRITLWQVEPLARLATLAHNSWGFPIQLKYSPDGQLLAASYNDNVGRVWRGEQALELKGHSDVVWDIAFSPDGSQIATLGKDDTIRLWDPETGQQTAMTDEVREVETRLWFSPDGRYLAASSRTGVAYLWDVTRPDGPPFVLAGHGEAVSAVAFSPCHSPPQAPDGRCDGIQLATASFDGTARLWDIDTRTSQARLVGHTGRLWWVSFSPCATPEASNGRCDGQYLVTASADHTARLWDAQLDQGGEIAARHYRSVVQFAAFAADGQSVVAVQDGLVRRWHPGTGDERAFPIDATAIRAAALSPDGATLAIADESQQVSLWDTSAALRADADRGDVRNFLSISLDTQVHGLAFHPSGRYLAMAAQDGSVRIWDVEAGAEQAVLTGHQNDVYAVAFSPCDSPPEAPDGRCDGDHLATGSGDFTVRLWNWRQREVERIIDQGEAPIRAIAFTPDGQRLAAADHDGTIRVWNLALLGDTPDNVMHNDSPVRALAFRPDGKWLVAGDENGVVSLWNWRRDEPILFRGHQRWITSIAFDPEGQTIVTAGQDGTVRVWPAQAQTAIDMACRRVGRSMPEAEWQQYVGDDVPYQPICPEAPNLEWTEAERLPPPGPPYPSADLLPAPSLPVIYYFEAIPGTRVGSGESVLLRWDLGNAREVFLYPAEGNPGVVAPDQRSVTLTQTVTYRLEARNDFGQVERELTLYPRQ